MLKHVYEHLKTRKKYNTLEIKLIGAREDVERLGVEKNTQKRIFDIKKDIWENTLKEQEEEIIKLKQEIVNLKAKAKEKNKKKK